MYDGAFLFPSLSLLFCVPFSINRAPFWTLGCILFFLATFLSFDVAAMLRYELADPAMGPLK